MKRVVSVISSSRISRGRNSNGKIRNRAIFFPNAKEFEWRFSKLALIKTSIASLISADCRHICNQNNHRIDAADANAGTNATRFWAIPAAALAKADVKSWGP